MLPSPETNLRIAELPAGPRKTAQDLARSIRAQLAALGAYGEGGTPEEQKPDVDRIFDRILKESSTRNSSIAAIGKLTSDLTQLTELLRQTYDLTDLRVALRTERTADGSPLESKLKGFYDRTLDAHLSSAVRAYADGNMGFTPDLSKLRFDLTPEKLVLLREGLESGALDGAVVVAYPTLPQLRKIAARTGRPLADLLALPVTTFLAEHFKARGGTIEFLLDEWAQAKIPPFGTGLSALFRAEGAKLGFGPGTWCDAAGKVTGAFKRVHAAVFDALPPQPALADVIGTSQLFFTNTTQMVMREVVQLTNEGAKTITQGRGFSFARCMQLGIDPLPPTGFLALAGTAASPKDYATYPTPRGIEGYGGNWEHSGALLKGDAACVGSSEKGLFLGADEASWSTYRSMVRPSLA